MDIKGYSKKTQKKPSTSAEKSNSKANNSKKKKAKNKKGSSKADPSKDSDPSPDALEIEGTCVLDQNQGVESDSSHQCQETVSKTNSTSKDGEPRDAEQVTVIVADASDTVKLQLSTSDKDKSAKSYSNSNVPNEDKTSNNMVNQTLTKQKSVLSNKGGNNKQRSNSSNVKSGYQFGAKFTRKIQEPANKITTVSSYINNESLRWENPAENSEEEEERIKMYKINRRKRYLAAAQAKGLGWVANYRQNGSPLSEDSGIETKERESRTNTRCDGHGSVPDYSSIQNMATNNSNSGLAMVEC